MKIEFVRGQYFVPLTTYYNSRLRLDVYEITTQPYNA